MNDLKLKRILDPKDLVDGKLYLIVKNHRILLTNGYNLSTSNFVFYSKGSFDDYGFKDCDEVYLITRD